MELVAGRTRVQRGSDFFPESLHFPSPEVEAQAVMKAHQETIAVGLERANVEAILQNFVIRRESQTFRKLNTTPHHSLQYIRR